MKKLLNARSALLGAILALPCLVNHAHSQSSATAEWLPTKTVRIIVPIVGSTNDVIARLVAPKLQEALGQLHRRKQTRRGRQYRHGHRRQSHARRAHLDGGLQRPAGD